MKNITIFLIAILPFLLLDCNGAKKATDSSSGTSNGIFVRSATLTSVLEEAQMDGKIVFLDMYTTWCAPCKVMDETVYTHPSVKEFLKDNMISYKVDAEKANGPDLSVIYNASVFPTLVFLDNKGREIVRSDGALGVTSFLELAQRAVDEGGL